MSYAVLARKSEAAPAIRAAATAGRATGGLRIGRPDDAFEQEADRVADAVMSGAASLQWSLSRMSIEPSLQRKCDCGGTGECEECKSKKTLQRKADGTAHSGEAPPIVHDVLNSPGRPLDDAHRTFFERRFGRDFSKVRIHTDDRAAGSAQAVQAQAYSVGSHVVFGRGRYRPNTEAGRKLLAHELAHTLQQRDTLARQPQQTPAPTPTTPPSLPARGTNPADCIRGLCAPLARARTPANDSQAQALGRNWRTSALDCVRNGAAASNASHASDIVDNEAIEIPREIQDLDDSLRSARPARYREYLEFLRETCEHRSRHVYLEFHYNVVFENPTGGSRTWGTNPDWDEIEGALSALPVEATWGNPRLLRFRRAACHPDDVDQLGQCTGRGGNFVGGETVGAGAGVNQITIYDAGIGQQPYTRSRSLRLAATSQSIRHEVGHVMDQLLTQAQRDEFFANTMHWRRIPWDWIVATGANVPQSWQAERQNLRTQTGMDDAHLNQWLTGLQVNTPVTVNRITFFKEPIGSSSFFLNSCPADQLPPGPEFEYARTNQGDYFAEIYTLAVSRPEFLSSALPPAQSEWLRRVVFHTPEHFDAVTQQATVLVEPLLGEFLARARRLFTREQLEALLQELIARSRHPGSQLA